MKDDSEFVPVGWVKRDWKRHWTFIRTDEAKPRHFMLKEGWEPVYVRRPAEPEPPRNWRDEP